MQALRHRVSLAYARVVLSLTSVTALTLLALLLEAGRKWK
jgi:hypothetical protein